MSKEHEIMAQQWVDHVINYISMTCPTDSLLCLPFPYKDPWKTT